MKWYKVLDNTFNTTKPFLEKVKVNGKGICLVGDGSEVFALGSTCPHAGADLSGGWCRDGKLICPFHRFAYDLRTGRGDPGQNDYVDIYPVEVREDGIYIGFLSLSDKIRSAFK